MNTKTVKRGSKLVYQVWLDTTKFTEANNIQYVGVSDTYDADKLDVNAADIKAYDSVTGADVTAKFDIKVENGTITATSKDEFIKDKENIAPTIFDNSLKTMINNVCTDIYTYQLKNIHYLCLNDYFGELISRHKIILKEIHQVYFKANMWLEITKDKQYILKWDTLI